LLTTPATGNSGKREALEFLNTREPRVPLVGIDLSCKTMGGGWDAENRECDSPVFLSWVELKDADLLNAHLQGTDLFQADLQGAYLSRSDLRGADLSRADLQGAHLSWADLRGADLFGANLQGSHLREADLQRVDLGYVFLQGADLALADMRGAYLRGAHLEEVKLFRADLRGANVSIAVFTRARLDGSVFSDPETGQQAWAWADQPPVGLDGVDIQLCVFDRTQNHQRETRPDPCIPPNPPAPQ